jgi:hypothetical protein
MKPHRMLRLRREALTELDPAELALARGGWAPPTFQHPDCSLDDLAYELTLHTDCSWSCP